MLCIAPSSIVCIDEGWRCSQHHIGSSLHGGSENNSWSLLANLHQFPEVRGLRKWKIRQNNSNRGFSGVFEFPQSLAHCRVESCPFLLDESYPVAGRSSFHRSIRGDDVNLRE